MHIPSALSMTVLLLLKRVRQWAQSDVPGMFGVGGRAGNRTLVLSPLLITALEVK